MFLFPFAPAFWRKVRFAFFIVVPVLFLLVSVFAGTRLLEKNRLLIALSPPPSCFCLCLFSFASALWRRVHLLIVLSPLPLFACFCFRLHPPPGEKSACLLYCRPRPVLLVSVFVGPSGEKSVCLSYCRPFLCLLVPTFICARFLLKGPFAYCIVPPPPPPRRPTPHPPVLLWFVSVFICTRLLERSPFAYCIVVPVLLLLVSVFVSTRLLEESPFAYCIVAPLVMLLFMSVFICIRLLATSPFAYCIVATPSCFCLCLFSFASAYWRQVHLLVVLSPLPLFACVCFRLHPPSGGKSVCLLNCNPPPCFCLFLFSFAPAFLRRVRFLSYCRPFLCLLVPAFICVRFLLKSPFAYCIAPLPLPRPALVCFCFHLHPPSG